MTELDKLFAAAKNAYDAWERAVERRDEDMSEAESYAQSIRLGVPVDPSVLTPPAPENAVEEAKSAYIDALENFGDSAQEALDELPDPVTDAPESLTDLIANHMARHH